MTPPLLSVSPDQLKVIESLVPDVFMACRDAGSSEREDAVGYMRYVRTYSPLDKDEDMAMLKALHKEGVFTKCEPVPDVAGPGVYLEFSERGALAVVEALFSDELGMMNYNVGRVWEALERAGIPILRIEQGIENTDAGIYLREHIAVEVGSKAAHLNVQDNDAFDMGVDHAIGQLAPLIEEVRLALSQS